MPLQGEGAVQGLLAATPDVTEGDLLREGRQGQGREASLPCPQRLVMRPASGSAGTSQWAVQASPSGQAEEEELVKGPSAEKGSIWGRRHKSGCVSVCARVCMRTCTRVRAHVCLGWKPCRLSGVVRIGAGTGM